MLSIRWRCLRGVALALALLASACAPAGAPTPAATTIPSPPPAPPPTAAPATAAPAPTVLATPEPRRCRRSASGPTDLHFGAAEAFRNLPAAVQAGVSWDRIVFSWQYVQRTPQDWNAHHYFRDADLCGLLQAGVQVVGLLQDSPTWVRAEPGQGATSPPVGLRAPWDSPENAWARFVERMAADYRGQIDAWIIWNEPEFRPTDQGGLYVTWSGDAEDYYHLLKTAYLAAKASNPEAKVVFSATSYWIDRLNGREQFLKRVLDVAALDPDAPPNGFFFDAVALNLYWSPDDLWRIARETRAILASRGLDKPLWISETNAPPWDDPATPKARNGQRVTLQVQAAFVLQAYALGIAAGYERIGWHAMTDNDTSDELWGLARNDGTLRPAYTAYQVAARYLANAERVTFQPLQRAQWAWQSGGYYPNWQVYLVVFDRGTRRVSVLWNGDGQPLRVQLPRRGTSATVVDPSGREQPGEAQGDRWAIELPPASARGPADPPGYYFVGGEPRLLVEEGVPAGSPVEPPRLVAQPAPRP
ncbi:MAG: hypothetical protein HY690_04185 [Chloroflexi bacterium]|nr:hypothetical protein [Chloroflexota bacterium]